jgi:alpha-tubulin suppressor-like RCC1 family protein
MTGRRLGLPPASRGTAQDRASAGRSTRSRTGRSLRRRAVAPLALIALTGALAMTAAAPASANDVIAWGGNAHHQLADGLTGNSDVPRLVCKPAPEACPGTHLENVIAVSAGGEHSLALLAPSGEVVAWGRNTDGDLGDGTTAATTQPVYVCKVAASGPCQTALDAGERLTGVIAISAGNADSNIALLSNEKVLTWGSNSGGQLGIGSATPAYSDLPVQPCSVGPETPCTSGPYLEGIAAVSAAPAHDVAITTSNREAVSWGADKVGQLGRGDWYKTPPGSNRALPVCQVEYSGDYFGPGPAAGEHTPLSTCTGKPLTGVVSVSFGLQHNVALIYGFPPGQKSGKGEGEKEIAEEYEKREHEGKEGVYSVVAWGYNNDGQLGDHEAPATGPNHCWTSHLPCSEVPVPVCLPEYSALIKPCTGGQALETASAVAAGGSHSLALVNGENVVSWGEAQYGTLGNRTTGPNSYVPRYVCESRGTGACPGNLKGVSAISAGEYHNLALLGSGEVVSWGQNTHGQLGNGEEGTASVPETCGTNGCSDGPVHVCQVGGPGGSGCTTLTGAIEVSAGKDHSLAVGEYTSPLVWYKKNVELTKGAANQVVTTSGTLTLHTIAGPIECKVKDTEEIWNPLSGNGQDLVTTFTLGTCKSGLCPKPQKTEVNALGLNWPSHLIPGPPVRDQIEKVELEIRCSGSGLLDKYKGTLTPEVGNGVLAFGAGSGELEDSGTHKANITGSDKLTATPGKITAH